MNRNQKLVLLSATLLLLAALVFPPFKYQYLQGITANAGYAFILNPPRYKLSTTDMSANINVTLLGLEYLFISTVAGLIFLVFRSK